MPRDSRVRGAEPQANTPLSGRRASDRAKTALFALAERLFGRNDSKPVEPPRRILVLQLQQVGDTVIFTPTLRALKQRYPDARIDILANGTSSQLYRRSPHVDTVHVAPRRSSSGRGPTLWPLLPLLRRLRGNAYDIVITDVTELAFTYALIAFLVGNRCRIGFNVAHRGFLHTMHIPFRPDAPYVDCNLDIARALGCRDPGTREEIAFTSDERAYIDSLLNDAGISTSEPIVVMHPGSNWQSKTWWPDRWAATADALTSMLGARVVFVGTAGEASTVDEIMRLMKQTAISLVARTDLLQLAALAARGRTFVGTDSGPRNIAGAVGAPTVVVMSAQEDTNRWVGVRMAEEVLRADARCAGCYFSSCAHRLCMFALTPGHVLAACERLLATDARTAWPAQPVPVAVPEILYERLTGQADADCQLLRRLARASRGVHGHDGGRAGARGAP